jgi:hypothetical protein
MFESRAIIRNIQEVKASLDSLGAWFLGSYVFTDFMYFSAADCFVRIRVYKHTNWNTKNVVVHKKTEWTGTVKKSAIPDRKYFFELVTVC